MARSGLAGGGQGEWLGMGVGSREFPMCGGGEGRGCASVVGGTMGGRKGGAWASGGLAVDLAGVVPGSQATRPCDGGGQKAPLSNAPNALRCGRFLKRRAPPGHGHRAANRMRRPVIWTMRPLSNARQSLQSAGSRLVCGAGVRCWMLDAGCSCAAPFSFGCRPQPPTRQTALIPTLKNSTSEATPKKQPPGKLMPLQEPTLGLLAWEATRAQLSWASDASLSPGGRRGRKMLTTLSRPTNERAQKLGPSCFVRTRLEIRYHMALSAPGWALQTGVPVSGRAGAVRTCGT